MNHPSQKQITMRSGKVFGGGKLLACAPLISKTLDALVADAEVSVKESPDILEWRSDFYEDIESSEKIAEAAKALRAVIGDTPVIFTPRMIEEGGKITLTPDNKRDVIRAVCETGCIDFVDLELAFGEEYIAGIKEITAANNVQLILSNHNFKCMPDVADIETTLKNMEAYGADINKLAYLPVNFHDVAMFSQLVVDAKKTWMKNPVIASLMGDVGAVTRFGGGSLGSDMCFISVTGVSGPGQMHISDYRILNALIDG